MRCDLFIKFRSYKCMKESIPSFYLFFGLFFILKLFNWFGLCTSLAFIYSAFNVPDEGNSRKNHFEHLEFKAWCFHIFTSLKLVKQCLATGTCPRLIIDLHVNTCVIFFGLFIIIGYHNIRVSIVNWFLLNSYNYSEIISCY